MMYDGQEVEFEPTLGSIEDYLDLLVRMSENQELSHNQEVELIHVLRSAYHKVKVSHEV